MLLLHHYITTESMVISTRSKETYSAKKEETSRPIRAKNVTPRKLIHKKSRKKSKSGHHKGWAKSSTKHRFPRIFPDFNTGAPENGGSFHKNFWGVLHPPHPTYDCTEQGFLLLLSVTWRPARYVHPYSRIRIISVSAIVEFCFRNSC